MKIDLTSAGVQADAARWKDQITSGSKALKQAGLGSIPGTTLKNARSPEALANTIDIFKKFFTTEAAKLTQYTADRDSWETVATTMLNNIIEQSLGKLEGNLHAHPSQINRMLKKADHLSTQAINDLKERAISASIVDMRKKLLDTKETTATRPTACPNIFLKEDGVTLSLVRERPPIENLILSGGGGRGLGLPPALKEIRAAGFFDNLKKVVGSSVGALIATSIAVGQDSDALTMLVDNFDVSWLNSNSNVEALYPEITFSKSFVSKTGIGIVQRIDEATITEVKNFLASHESDSSDLDEKITAYAEKNGLVYPDGIKARIKDLANAELTEDRSGKMVTFNDLKMLHAIEPSKFKEIELTGFKKSLGGGDSVVIFKAGAEHGDLPVAFAARASMAHPAIASYVKFPLWHDGHIFADGGIKSNCPAEAVYEGNRGDAVAEKSGVKRNLQEIAVRTLLMVFDSGGEAYTRMHADAPSRARDSAAARMGRLVGNSSLGADRQADRDKIYAAGGNSFVVFHGNIGTLDIRPTEMEARAAREQSTLKTLEQLINLTDIEGAAYMVDVETVEEAFSLLSPAEKKAIIAAKAPELGDYGMGDLAERSFVPANKLYKLAVAEASGIRSKMS